MSSTPSHPLQESITRKLKILYGKNAPEVFNELINLLNKYKNKLIESNGGRTPYSYKDVYLISYGDSLLEESSSPLSTLRHFAENQIDGLINGIHILPFFPFSSDDGFSVIDYKKVREDLGTWDDVEKLADRFNIMGDLVINHVSASSVWFKNFLNQKHPEKEYFHDVSPMTDVTKVVRPRSTPVLTPVETTNGLKHVWTTFSPDQVDVNFQNPRVLLEYLDILLFYLSKGIKVIRLDAVAFLWKKQGTSCIHLPETHEVIKLIREVAEHVVPDCIIITETNVPHKENVSYFGNGDEAHMVYNFSLPPLLYHAILTENASYLSEWSKQLTQPPEGCTYFNFAASHDGIGVRPLEGLIPHEDFLKVVRSVYDKGGQVSYKQNPDGIETPYELNIAYFDAFKDPQDESAESQIARFFCSQALMLSFRGVPAIYIHSLLGTPNYTEGVKKTGIKRTINRRRLDYKKLNKDLEDQNSSTNKVLERWKRILSIRVNEPAFDPQGIKEVLQTDNSLFAMKRSTNDGKHNLLIVANVTSAKVNYRLDVTFKRASELITGSSINKSLNSLELNPWQVMWIKYIP